MISLIQSIISISIISLIWIWIIRQIFIKQSKQQIIKTSIWSIMSVISISIIYYLSNTYTLRKEYHTIIYITIIIISIFLFIQKKRTISWIIQSLWRIIISSIWGIWWNYSINTLWEESFKRIYIKKFIIWLMWEIILLWIISGIVFGRTENIVYLIQSISRHTFIDNVMLIQQRSFIPILIHVWSICISILVWYWFQKRIWEIASWTLGLASGILVHYLFNISQTNSITIWTITIILLYIWVIHYSLFRSDLLYIWSENK